MQIVDIVYLHSPRHSRVKLKNLQAIASSCKVSQFLQRFYTQFSGEIHRSLPQINRICVETWRLVLGVDGKRSPPITAALPAQVALLANSPGVSRLVVWWREILLHKTLFSGLFSQQYRTIWQGQRGLVHWRHRKPCGIDSIIINIYVLLTELIIGLCLPEWEGVGVSNWHGIL